MQLRLQPRKNKGPLQRTIIIKTVLIVLFLFVAVFILDKIEVPVPTKNIKQEISNDKLIKLK